MKKNNNLLRNWISLFLILLLVFFGVKFLWSSLNSPVNSQNQEVKAFVIAPGEGTSSIASRLEKEGFIKSANVFKLKLFLSGDSKIEAGDFKLSPSMNTNEIIEALSKGSIDKWVTLIEGLRVEEIAEKLNKEIGVSEDEFIAVAKEGYMFPDTYLFNPDSSVSDIAARMEENFNSKVTDKLKNKFSQKGLSLDEAVNLASIVEREGRSDKVRTEIAGILLKRLNTDMGLNADATLQYALGYQPEEKTWWKRHLTSQDKLVESLYNTYKYRGLPPAPISNPSLSSLEAVGNSNPNTPYLYYYHDSEGNSHYARTLEEHNENIATYP